MLTSLKTILIAAALACATSCCCTDSVCAPEEAKAYTPVDMSDPAVMAKMMEFGTPGEEHAELAKMVGSWTTHYKMRMAPDQPWQEVDGTCENSLLLGGRFVKMDVKCNMMGMDMEGLQLFGFDKIEQEYIALWTDSWSTWWVECRGKADANGVIHMKGTMKDVAGERPYRMVMTPKGDDMTEVEMYDTIPPKGEVLVMSMVTKRKR